MIKLRWMKVPTAGRAYNAENVAPLAMVDEALPGARASFYKLQYSVNGADWVDVEIGADTTPVIRFIDGKAVRS